MATILEVFVLAVIQGLTEWLPVSSSGHLVITQEILGLELPLFFDSMLHVGTLIVILIVFQKDIVKIIKALIKRNFKTEEGQFALLIAIGSVPIAVVGFTFHNIIESFFSNLLVVGLALMINGGVLYFSEKNLGTRKIGILDSFIIGLAQAIALIPGISRSGLTVSTGLLRTIDKSIVFRYSFLLSAPAVLGATIFESRELFFGNVDIVPIIFGVIISIITGYLSLNFLKKIVMSKKIHLFSYYCWTFGTAIIFFIFFK